MPAFGAVAQFAVAQVVPEGELPPTPIPSNDNSQYGGSMSRAVNTQVDRFNLYVQSQDLNAEIMSATAPNVDGSFPTINVVATNALISALVTATGTNVSPELVNTVHRGIQLYLSITSLSVNTATLAVNLLGKDPVSGNFFQVGRVSLDGMSGNQNVALQFYPGVSGTNRDSVALPPRFEVQASLTIVTSASMSGLLSYQIGGATLI